MSTELNIRIWFDDNKKSSEHLASLIEAVSQSSLGIGSWDQLIGRERNFKDSTVCEKGAKAGDLIQTAIEAQSKYESLSGGVACELWRFSGMHAERSSMRLGIDAWEQGCSIKPERKLDGDAQLWFPAVGPFVALIDESAESAVNAKVEENVESLTELLQSIIRLCAPTKILIHSGAGMHHLLNAHALWLKSQDLLLEEIRFFSELWDNGNADWKLPPLGNETSVSDGEYFHLWRSEEEKQELWAGLTKRLKQSTVTREKVEEVLANQSFDFFGYKKGFLLFDYPWMLNNFIDRFILSVLDVD